jgi:cysteine desulfurase / selenocysteine lyase
MVVSEKHMRAERSQSSPDDWDSAKIRSEFPILRRKINGHPLVYLDNAATTQKPQSVIDAIIRYYCEGNSNVHRGVHTLSQEATDQFEAAREKVRRFLGAAVPCEIIFTRGATEAINLVAHSYGNEFIGEGDEVLITHMEHHSNILPWQMLCERKGATLKVAPIHDDGSVDMEAFEKLLNERTKMVAVVQISNALGTVNPVRRMAGLAHGVGAKILVDGAQSTPHTLIKVDDLDCDFFVCSGHKMYGPTGIGVLYGRAALLDKMPPYQSGGDMILSVTFEKTVFNYLPHKFEAGTPHIEGVIGLAAAIDYLNALGMERVAAYEKKLLAYGTALLESIPGIRLVGTAKEKAGVLSFTMDQAHPHDIGQILDDNGVAVRAGHHCAQPVMQRFGVAATSRASLGLYNTIEDLDRLGSALQEVNKVFG